MGGNEMEEKKEMLEVVDYEEKTEMW